MNGYVIGADFAQGDDHDGMSFVHDFISAQHKSEAARIEGEIIVLLGCGYTLDELTIIEPHWTAPDLFQRQAVPKSMIQEQSQ